MKKTTEVFPLALQPTARNQDSPRGYAILGSILESKPLETKLFPTYNSRLTNEWNLIKLKNK